MRNKAAVIFAIFFGVSIVSGVWGSNQFPSEFDGLVPKLIGADVYEIKRTRDMTRATFRTDSKPKTVFEFYKEALEKGGWQIESCKWDAKTGKGKILSEYEGKDPFKQERRILKLTVSEPETLTETEFIIEVEFVGGIE